MGWQPHIDLQHVTTGGAVCGTRNYTSGYGDTSQTMTFYYHLYQIGQVMLRLPAAGTFNIASDGKVVVWAVIKKTGTVTWKLQLDDVDLTWAENTDEGYLLEGSWCGDMAAGDHHIDMVCTRANSVVYDKFIKLQRMF